MRRRLLVVPVVVALNVAVFVAWQLAPRGSASRLFLNENFLISTWHLVHGRVWALLTAAFSHNELWHLLLNMVVLMSFGQVLERLWGRRLFAGFYLTAAVVSSASHCLTSLIIGRGAVPALGASGALSGLLLAFALLFPHHRILVFGLVPLPALAGALAFVGLDIWGLVAQGRGGGLPIGHGAHLGGAACGLLFWAFYLRPRLQRRRGTTMPKEDRDE